MDGNTLNTEIEKEEEFYVLDSSGALVIASDDDEIEEELTSYEDFENQMREQLLAVLPTVVAHVDEEEAFEVHLALDNALKGMDIPTAEKKSLLDEAGVPKELQEMVLNRIFPPNPVSAIMDEIIAEEEAKHEEVVIEVSTPQIVTGPAREVVETREAIAPKPKKAKKVKKARKAKVQKVEETTEFTGKRSVKDIISTNYKRASVIVTTVALGTVAVANIPSCAGDQPSLQENEPAGTVQIVEIGPDGTMVVDQ